MPVLDVRSLKAEQLNALAAAYDRLAQDELMPLAQLDHDPTRCQVDETLSTVLDTPSLAPIGELLAREPGMTAEEINPHLTQASLPVKDDEKS